MNIPKRNFITRKELAQVLEVSVRTVERNEHRLGLDVARRDLNSRMVRYIASIAERELRMRQQWPES